MRFAHSSKHSVIRRVIMASAVLAAVAGVGATAARADDGYGYRGDRRFAHEERRREELRHREWREHQWRERHAYEAPRYYYAPGYTYAPRPVYPPPAYVQPGVNLGFYFR